MAIACSITTRNEGDILELCIRHNVRFFDRLYVTDHASSDATPEILKRLLDEGLPLELSRLDDDEEFDQGALSTQAVRALAPRYSFVFLLDADEFVGAKSRAEMDSALRNVPLANCAKMHHATWAPPLNASATTSIHTFRRRIPEAQGYHKIVVGSECAALVNIGPGNHYAVGSDRREWPAVLLPFPCNHVPLRSPEQLIYKNIRWAAAWSAQKCWAWGEQTYAEFGLIPRLRERGFRVDWALVREAAQNQTAPPGYKVEGEDPDACITDVVQRWPELARVNLLELLDREVEHWAKAAAAVRKPIWSGSTFSTVKWSTGQRLPPR